MLTVVAAAVAQSTCVLNAGLLARSRVDQMQDDARLVAQTLYHNASGVIRRSAGIDLARALRTDAGLRSQADAVIGYSPVTLYVAIIDRDGTALFHSNPSLQGSRLPPRQSIQAFAEQSVLGVLWSLWREDQTLVVDLPFSINGENQFGSIQVAVSTLLLHRPLIREVAVNAFLASGAVIVVFFASFALANRLLAPLEMLRAELSKVPTARGEPPLDLRSEEDIGRVAQFFASISERLRTEWTEEPRKDWLGAMLHGVSDAVIVLDGERRVVSLNEGARRLLGSLDGAPIDDGLPADHPVAAITREAFDSGTDVPRRPCLLRRNGKEVPHSLNARIIRQNGAIDGLMITARDLDKLSQIASRLSYSQKLSSLGRLTSGVAHEIKNPLNAIVMHSALLRRKLAAEDESVVRHLDVLDDEIHRLDRVVLGFLAFSRPDELRLESVDLVQVVRAAVDKVCGDAEQVGIRVDFDGATDPSTVPGDSAMLEQVFCNLLTNAREAMAGGGLLSIELQRSDEGIRVTVRDTGMGIPAESISKIFGLYYSTKERGSGIGLSVVYRIVQLHGGEVTVWSEPGTGTAVSVTLPEAPE